MSAQSITLIGTLWNPGSALGSFLREVESTLDVVDEVILVDDGSHGDTWKALRSWSASKPAVKLLRNDTNQGVAASRNRALRHSTGEFVWFVDHDDDWDAAPLRQLPAVDADVDVVWFRAMYFPSRTHPGRVCDGLAAPLISDAATAIQLLLVRKVDGFLWSKLIRRTQIPPDVFPALSSQSDIVGVARVLARSRKVQFCPAVLYHWRQRQGSITRSSPNFANLERALAAIMEAC